MPDNVRSLACMETSRQHLRICSRDSRELQIIFDPHVVILAGDIDEALHLICSRNVDCIIVDLALFCCQRLPELIEALQGRSTQLIVVVGRSESIVPTDPFVAEEK